MKLIKGNQYIDEKDYTFIYVGSWEHNGLTHITYSCLGYGSFGDDSPYHKSLKLHTPVRPIEEVMADLVGMLEDMSYVALKEDSHYADIAGKQKEVNALLAEAQALGVVE